MKRRAIRSSTPEDAPAETSLPVGLGWSVALDRRPGVVTLSLRHPDRQPFQVEIALTRDGPVLRAQATGLVLEAAEDIVARCRRFEVDASETATIRAHDIVQTAEAKISTHAAEVEVGARAGDIRLHANDDVQLLGEQVLLNCDRPAPAPRWLPPPPRPESVLPRQDTFGDADLSTRPASE